jgi:ATP-dependent DNA ligase
MLVACSGQEAKFLIRGLQGKLRIGLAEKTVIVSLAHAVTLTPPARAAAAVDEELSLEDAEALLKQVLCELPSYDVVIPALLDGGIAEARRRCQLTPGARFVLACEQCMCLSLIVPALLRGRHTCRAYACKAYKRHHGSVGSTARQFVHLRVEV